MYFFFQFSQFYHNFTRHKQLGLITVHYDLVISSAFDEDVSEFNAIEIRCGDDSGASHSMSDSELEEEFIRQKC